MTIEDDIGFLERVPTLGALGRDALRILAIGAENRYVHGGVVLFTAGELSEAAYVVQDGSFQLHGAGENPEHPSTVGPGTILCPLALLIDLTYPVSATACQPSTVIRISRSLFRKMLEGYPGAAARLHQQLLAQIDQSTEDMVRVRAKLAGLPAR